MRRGALGILLAGSWLGCAAPKLSSEARRAEVELFMTTDCPLSNSYAPELARIIERYSPFGVRFVLVYVDPEVTLAEARRHAREFGLEADVLLDPDHHRVDRRGIEVTPEAAVLLPDGTLAYRGRIDDRVIALGRVRPEPTRRDLREALEAVVSGRPVPNPRTTAVGCFIPGHP